MSARDNFMKKAQENSASQQNLTEKVKRDTQNYRARLHDLTKQIDEWLHNTGVAVSIKETNFRDENISFLPDGESLSQYRANTLTMKHGQKTALLEPVSVYGEDARGTVLLSIDNPNRSPRDEKFILQLDKAGLDWTIRRAVNPSTITMNSPLVLPENPLTEESFFGAIESLA